MCSGIAGYARTRSLPSLVAGVGVGALYGVAAFRISDHKKYAYETAIVASVLMATSMVPKAMKTTKAFPVTLAVCSVATGAYYTKKLVEHW